MDNKLRLFYDAHPRDRSAAMIMPPKNLLDYVEQINNTEDTIENVIDRIQEIVPKCAIKVVDETILVYVTDGGYKHVWRIIKHKEP